MGHQQLCWGPWGVPESFGTISNAFACLYLILLLFWSFWPPVTPVIPPTMNFSVVTFGGTLILSLVWYFIRGHKQFSGPIVEIEQDDESVRSVHV